MTYATVSSHYIPTDDPGCLSPVSQCFLVICPAVMIVAKVRVRIYVSVVIMKPR